MCQMCNVFSVGDTCVLDDAIIETTTSMAATTGPVFATAIATIGAVLDVNAANWLDDTATGTQVRSAGFGLSGQETPPAHAEQAAAAASSDVISFASQSAEFASQEQAAQPEAAAAPEGTLDELADYLLQGFWDYNSEPARSFDMTDDNIITVNLTALNEDGLMLARMALEAWEMVCDIEFVETTEKADIKFLDRFNGAFSDSNVTGTTIDSSYVNVDTDWIDNYGTTIDSYSYSTFVHEIGHAIGLGHQGAYNGSATYGVDETFSNDSWHLSIMSYFDQTDNTTDPSDYAALTSTMIVDIIAVQDIYGVPVGSATSGDTVYGSGTTLTNYMGDLFTAVWDTPDASVYDPSEAISMTIYDESGIDLIDFSPDTFDQVVDLKAEGSSTIAGVVGSIVIARDTVIENYNAGSGDDEITGNSAANIIHGGDGNDMITSGAGKDTNYGDAGDDTLYGRGGFDTLDGGTGNDTLNGNEGNDDLTGGAGDDTLNGGKGNDIQLGNSGDDLIFGQSGADFLSGQNDDDYINGGNGTDTLYGGMGNDTLLGGKNHDLIKGDAGLDTLRGDGGNDTLMGGDGDDMLFGGGGNDMLYGGAGLDTLDGGKGNDVITGGSDADVLIFRSGQDTIVDFEDDIDIVQIDDALWGGATATVEDILNAATVIGGDTVIDFGAGNTLTIAGLTDISLLENDIFII